MVKKILLLISRNEMLLQPDITYILAGMKNVLMVATMYEWSQHYFPICYSLLYIVTSF
jgi:hypothetical protein